MRNLQATPARMVEANGSVNFGAYRTPFRDANILDAPLYSFSVPGFWKKFRLKEWQHFGIITPSHYFGVVIFDAKFMGASFFYSFDRRQKIRFEHSRQLAWRSAKVASQTYDGVCVFEAPGYRIRIENKLDAGFHRLDIDIDGDKKRPAVKGEVTVYEDLRVVEPMIQVSPITKARPFYTHKAAVPAAGRICVGDEEIIFERDTAIALIDEQKTYYPYFSFWKWSTAAGFMADGRIMAFNLCQNMIADDEDNNENCFWIDGKIHFLKAARFDFGEIMKPWQIKTTDSALDLSFEPQGERSKKVTAAAGLILSDFHQPFGIYNGTFRDEQGVTHPIKDFFGLAEHHITRY